jgi:hypothetical protein
MASRMLSQSEDRYTQGLHGVISLDMILFITIAVKTSNPTTIIIVVMLFYGRKNGKKKLT